MTATPRYHRVLLKVSGEALLGDRAYGVDPAGLPVHRQPGAPGTDAGVEVAIVVGGGNIFRGLAAAAKGMERATGDYMGMLATVMNGLALQDALEKDGVPTRVMSAIGMNEVAEPYIRRRADAPPREGPRRHPRRRYRQSLLHDRHGRRPARRGDRRPGAAQGDQGGRRLHGGPQVTNPTPSATTSSPTPRSWRDRLNVLDATAVSLCMENDLPIVVFDMNQPDNIRRAAVGEPIGTLIPDGRPRSMTDAGRPDPRTPRWSAPWRPWSATSRPSAPAARRRPSWSASRSSTTAP